VLRALFPRGDDAADDAGADGFSDTAVDVDANVERPSDWPMSVGLLDRPQPRLPHRQRQTYQRRTYYRSFPIEDRRAPDALCLPLPQPQQHDNDDNHSDVPPPLPDVPNLLHHNLAHSYSYSYACAQHAHQHDQLAYGYASCRADVQSAKTPLQSCASGYNYNPCLIYGYASHLTAEMVPTPSPSHVRHSYPHPCAPPLPALHRDARDLLRQVPYFVAKVGAVRSVRLGDVMFDIGVDDGRIRSSVVVLSDELAAVT
jgi:hypothetical protein